MSSNKKVLISSSEEKKTFSYELDGVSFNFSLRVDIKKELVAGKKLLERAITDFEKELTQRF